MRNVDVLNLLPAGRAVDGRGFVQLRVDGGQRGNIKDSIPTGVLPNVRTDEQRAEPVFLDHEVNRLAPAGFYHLVDDAVGGGEEQVEHTSQHDRGDEVRNVNRRLREALEALRVQLVEHDGEQNRNGEGEQQSVEVQQQCVCKHASAVVHAEEIAEVFEQVKLPFCTCPRTGGDAQADLEVFEGNLDTVHREVAKYNEESQCWNQQNPQLPVAVNCPPSTNTKRLMRFGRCRLCYRLLQ